MKPNPLSPQSDDSRRNQFLDLTPDLRILKMVLQRSRITLGLLQDTLHDRVLKYAHHIRVLCARSVG